MDPLWGKPPSHLESLSEYSNEPNVPIWYPKLRWSTFLVLLSNLESLSGPPNLPRDPSWYYQLIVCYFLKTCHVLPLTWGSFEEAVGLVVMGSHHSLQYLDLAIKELIKCFFPKNMKLCYYVQHSFIMFAKII